MQNSIEKLSNPPEKAEEMRMRTWPDQKRPNNPEVCREKGGHLQMGDDDSKRKNLTRSAWGTGGRNRAEWRGGRGNKGVIKKQVLEMEETVPPWEVDRD